MQKIANGIMVKESVNPISRGVNKIKRLLRYEQDLPMGGADYIHQAAKNTGKIGVGVGAGVGALSGALMSPKDDSSIETGLRAAGGSLAGALVGGPLGYVGRRAYILNGLRKYRAGIAEHIKGLDPEGRASYIEFKNFTKGL